MLDGLTAGTISGSLGLGTAKSLASDVHSRRSANNVFPKPHQCRSSANFSPGRGTLNAGSESLKSMRLSVIDVDQATSSLPISSGN